MKLPYFLILSIYINRTYYDENNNIPTPRPQLIDLLGLHYRRIPVLAIGRDVYCDTFLMAAKLEEKYPVAAGYKTIFPPLKSGGRSDPVAQQLLALG